MSNLTTAYTNFITIGVQSTDEAVLVSNDYMLAKYHTVNGDVQLKFLKDIFNSLLPYCEQHNDYDAVQQINTKLLQTLNK
jgi:hypothetical protein